MSVLNRYIEYCRECADKAFQTWEGWPNKTPVPSLPLVQDNGCAECGSTVGVLNVNYRGRSASINLAGFSAC